MNLLIITLIAAFVWMVYGIYTIEQEQENYCFTIGEKVFSFILELFTWPLSLVAMVCSKEFKKVRKKLLLIWILGSTVTVDLSIIAIFHLPPSLIHTMILMVVVGPIIALIISYIWFIVVVGVIFAYGRYYDYRERRTEE